MRKVYLFSLLLFFVVSVSAQTISYNTLASTYSQNFDGLPNSGTYTIANAGPLELTPANGFGTTVQGWYLNQTVGVATITWVVGTGSSNTGAAYTFGSAAATDRAFGALASGTRIHRWGALIVNNTGSTINKFTISFYTEMWRRGSFASGNTNAFEYKVGGTAINDASGFVTAASLNMVTPNLGATNDAAADGNLAANRALVTATVGGLSWTNGTTLVIRWSDANETGNDDGLAIDDFTFSADVQTTTNFYSKSTGNLTDLTTWGTNTDGTGTQPVDFISDYQQFNVVNRASVTLDANWTVSGIASKVIVGEGTTGTELIIPNTATLTGTSDVTNLSTLRLENSTLPTVGTLANGSTVNYAQTASPYAVPTGATYHHLGITNGTKTFASGTITVNGNLLVDGVTGFNGAPSPFTTINLAGNFTLQSSAAFEPVATGEGARPTLIATGAGTQVLSGGHFYLFRVQTSAASTVNVALGTGSDLTLGNPSGGGLNLQNAANTLTINSNTLTLYGAGLFSATHVGTLSGSATSNLTINKTSGTGNIGAVGFTTGAQTLNNFNYNANSGGNDDLSLLSGLTVNGNLTMTDGRIVLGTNSLRVNGTASGLSTSYVQTNGTGAFILGNVTGTRSAPIGNATYNPLIITHADNIDWSLRVEDAVAVADPTFSANVAKAVQREWHITPSTNPPATGADITFEWNDGSSPSQVGVLYSDAENVQIWHEVSQGSPWGDDWLAVGTAQAAGGTPGSTRTAFFTNWTWFSPFAISNISGPLPVKLTAFTAVRINDRNARINWELAACCSGNAKFELEKSADGTQFTRIAVINGSETSRFYDQYDINLGKGITYYRLRATDVDGKVTYSRIAAVINGTNGLVVAAPAPNPVSDATTVVVTLGHKENVSFVLADINGRIVRQWNATLPEGNNNVAVPTSALAGGTYYLTAIAGEAKAVVRFVKQ